jgi:hypothetical protein
MLLLVAVLTGCQSTGPAEQADDRPVYSTKTVDELISAVGPNRIIELDPEVTYRLDQAMRGVSDYYTWGNPLRDQHELVIRNCPSLTIRSAGPERAHIVTAHAYAYVLSFKNSDDLTLAGLKLGHAPDPGYCSGGVVAIDHTSRVTIRGCQLYGCGTDGLQLVGVRGLDFERSIIEDCSYGILSANDCRDLWFVGSTFRQCREFYGFAFSNSIGLSFEDCIVDGNTFPRRAGGQGLFFTNLNTPEAVIAFKGGRISGNRAGMLVQPEGMLSLDGAVLENNTFEKLK